MRLIDAEPIEQVLFKQADKSMAKNPYENARICAFRKAFELILDAPTIAPPSNEPLTLNELREMDEESVWICRPDGSNGMWALVDLEYELCRTAKGGIAIFDTYGKTWLAYRQKPEEG